MGYIVVSLTSVRVRDPRAEQLKRAVVLGKSEKREVMEG
jgi:hypothetical protein